MKKVKVTVRKKRREILQTLNCLVIIFNLYNTKEKISKYYIYELNNKMQRNVLSIHYIYIIILACINSEILLNMITNSWIYSDILKKSIRN